MTIPPRWEIGSEFHWSEDLRRDDAPPWLPGGAVLFATGAGAMLELLRQLGTRRIHLPSYFCLDVVDVIAPEVAISWYEHRPGGDGPRLETLEARPGDAVLALDLFGLEHAEPWDAWAAAHPDTVVVEDHTHDPLSDWSTHSTAPYCLSSLRKTLPVPDGAVLWSPQGLELPAVRVMPNPGAVDKLAAMRAKASWLRGEELDKRPFRRLQRRGEETLTGCAATASAFTRAAFAAMDVAALRDRRTGNTSLLRGALADGAGAGSWSLLPEGPAGSAPFRVQLLCADRTVRDGLRAHLADHGVYVAVHWPLEPGRHGHCDAVAQGLSERLLTLPLDHRYGDGDVRRVVDLLASFVPVPAA